MLTGHASHQIGLDVDIWLTPMPDRRLSADRARQHVGDRTSSPRAATMSTAAVWGPQYRQLIETVARAARAGADLRQSAIKRALCREAGTDRDWLRQMRPWWGHDDHFHFRLAARPATRCARTRPRRRPATVAARNSTGGSPKKRGTPSRRRRARRCWCRSCPRPARRWSSIRSIGPQCSRGAFSSRVRSAEATRTVHRRPCRA